MRSTAKINKEEFETLFYKQGLRNSDIASHFGVTVSAIGSYRHRNNLPPRGVVIPISRTMADTHPFRNGFHKGKPAHNKSLPDFFVCKKCGVDFKNITGHQRVFCSKKCYNDAKRNGDYSGGLYKPKELHRNWIKDRSVIINRRRDGTSFTRLQKKFIYERDKCCKNCGKDGKLGAYELQVDHIIAICLGGEHTLENGQILCQKCHVSKTKKDIRIKNKLLDMRMKLSDFFEVTNRAALRYS